MRTILALSLAAYADFRRLEADIAGALSRKVMGR